MCRWQLGREAGIRRHCPCMLSAAQRGCQPRPVRWIAGIAEVRRSSWCLQQLSGARGRAEGGKVHDVGDVPVVQGLCRICVEFWSFCDCRYRKLYEHLRDGHEPSSHSCREPSKLLPTRQVVAEEGPHPPAELVTVAARL